MKNKVIFITLALFLSCSSSENREKIESKKDEVMKIHDEAMNKMSEMAKLKAQLKDQLKTDSLRQDDIKLAIKDLEKADKQMWDWMHNYHHEIVDTSQVDSALKYLDDQYKSVKIVEEKINLSLKNGQELL